MNINVAEGKWKDNNDPNLPKNYAGTTITLKDGITHITLPAHGTGKIGAIVTVFGGGNNAEVEGNARVFIGR